MKHLEVTVAVRNTDGVPSLTVISQGGENVLHTVNWKLGDVEKEGYYGVCEKLGNAVMRLISLEDPGLFDKYPLLKPPVSFVANPVDMVMELMGLSSKFKTKVYVPAIDDLFRRYPEELEGTNLPNTWSLVREDYLKFPG